MGKSRRQGAAGATPASSSAAAEKRLCLGGVLGGAARGKSDGEDPLATFVACAYSIEAEVDENDDDVSPELARLGGGVGWRRRLSAPGPDSFRVEVACDVAEVIPARTERGGGRSAGIDDHRGG